MLSLGYNHGFTQKEVLERQKYEAIQNYLIKNDLLWVQYKVKGNTLYFRYNMEVQGGYATFERRVNLWNFSYKDVKLRIIKLYNWII